MSGGYWERDQKTGEVQTEECFFEERIAPQGALPNFAPG